MKKSLYLLLPFSFFLMATTSFSQDTLRRARASSDEQRRATDADSKVNVGDERIRRERTNQGLPSIKLSKSDSERVKEMRKVDPADITAYSGFLKNGKTGILKLFVNRDDCFAAKTMRVDGDCVGFIPLSSYFSFRTKQYSDAWSQDIGFVADELSSGGFFSQGIFVSLGNLPLEEITLDQPAVRYLADLPPEKDVSAARETAAKLREGLQAGGATYASNAIVLKDNTYALRLIAYKFGNSLSLSEQATSVGLLFQDLDLDKRVDLIVGLRVIRLDDGNATIVWKELSRKDAPKLKFAKGEPLGDFK